MSITPEQVCDDLIRLVEHVKKTTIQLAEARGLTKAQMFALYSIHHHQQLPMGKMAASMHCDASNVTGIVDRLVAQGLVSRQESEQDRRTKTLRLTTKGEQLVADLRAQLPACLCCDKLGADERQTLHAIIQKLCI